MARGQSFAERLAALLAKNEPKIAAAYNAGVRDIVDQAQVRHVIENWGDIEGAVRALSIEPAAYQGLDDAIRAAFIEGGAATAATLPAAMRTDPGGARVVIRFDVKNPRAEQWLSQHSSGLINEIVEDQRQSVRTALREGMELGANPRATVLSIIGRIDRVTGRREGGILGLTSLQERYVASARAELLSGDPALMRNYLTRGRRDRHFDAAVLKAIKSGNPLDAERVAKAVGRYSDRLLELRGVTIGRTESMASLNRAAMEAHLQAVEKGNVRAQDVRKIWVATKDKRTRDTHAAMNGEAVGLNDRFANGLLYPGDPDGEAAEVINCRCSLKYRIDFLSNLE